jgi:pimeloyl-ACP methyl ester carboxylesterase
MRRLKLLLLYFGLILLLLLLAGAFTIYRSGPDLPPDTDARIDQVMHAPLPRLVTGRTGLAPSGGWDIWYESVEPQGEPRGTVLLIMGISMDALAWPRSLIDGLVANGYRVVRHDHRSTGMSSWTARDGSTAPYSLADMARDGVAVLDTLGIAKANIVGISMGGMIAQELALNHPDRVATLTTLMSSGHIEDPALPPISRQVAFDLVKVALKYGLTGGERNMIKLHVAGRIILMGEARYVPDVTGIAQQVLYNMRARNGYNRRASRDHQVAVRLTGSRLERLPQLEVPTLVMHGTMDSFIPIEHSEKLAQTIPGARTLWIEGMGHELSPHRVDHMSAAMIAQFEQAAPSITGAERGPTQ